ncbi:MAG TPA: hypothetical protein VGM54_00755 [Chthoniobacter sp.]
MKKRAAARDGFAEPRSALLFILLRFERPILRWRDRHVGAARPSAPAKEWQLAFNI